jgi:hypothetical protein
MTPGFLIDEHLPKWWRRAILIRDPALEVLRIGGTAAPPLRTLDPVLLQWSEAHNFYLITDNRSTMPVHLANHLAAGRHVPGIFRVDPEFNIHSLIEHLQMIVGACSPDEFRDHFHYLPMF